MIRILIPVLIAALWGWISWRMSMKQMKANLERNTTPVDHPELEAVIRRLGRQVGIEHLQANVFKMDGINGLAMPDGKIYITSGLFQRFKKGEFTAKELGSVIAHELGHVARGHTSRRMIDWTGQSAARMALGMVLSRFIPFIGYYVASFLSMLVISRLTRRDEFEADEYATALMIRAGYGAEPQISMFEKLMQHHPDQGGVIWLKSHPPTEDRISAIRERASHWGTKPPVEKIE